MPLTKAQSVKAICYDHGMRDGIQGTNPRRKDADYVQGYLDSFKRMEFVTGGYISKLRPLLGEAKSNPDRTLHLKALSKAMNKARQEIQELH